MGDRIANLDAKIAAIKNSPEYKRLKTISRGQLEGRRLNDLNAKIEVYESQKRHYTPQMVVRPESFIALQRGSKILRGPAARQMTHTGMTTAAIGHKRAPPLASRNMRLGNTRSVAAPLSNGRLLGPTRNLIKAPIEDKPVARAPRMSQPYDRVQRSTKFQTSRPDNNIVRFTPRRPFKQPVKIEPKPRFPQLNPLRGAKSKAPIKLKSPIHTLGKPSIKPAAPRPRLSTLKKSGHPMARGALKPTPQANPIMPRVEAPKAAAHVDDTLDNIIDDDLTDL
jgi:hypothetical protein